MTILYTAPTAIRTFMKWGDEIPAKFDLSSLRLLGSVGEPINPEAWIWYREHIGGDRCPVVDTWWQTETGAIMISPLPGVTAAKPGSAHDRRCPASRPTSSTTTATPVPERRRRLPRAHRAVAVDAAHHLGRRRALPGDLLVAVREQGCYFAGDGAKKDDDGDLWLLGRVDDVMNVSGHRLSTTEIESALVSHPKVAEAAVVGATDETTGQAIVAFVILRGERRRRTATGRSSSELRDHVAKEIGADRQAAADHDRRRAAEDPLRQDHAPPAADVAENREVGDVTTLADSTVMDLISQGVSSGKAAEE